MAAENHQEGNVPAGDFPPQAAASECVGNDGGCNRSGTIWSTTVHIITSLIGYRVLSLAWAIAQLGYVTGPLALLFFSVVTYYSISRQLATCYCSGDHASGRRNSVENALGGFHAKIYAFLLYSSLVGVVIGYAHTASVSMTALKRSSCIHWRGDDLNPCEVSSGGLPYTLIIFGFVEIFFSQIPDFDRISWLSWVAAAMSFVYPSIGLGFVISKVVENGKIKGSLTGIRIGKVTHSQKIWSIFQALGDVAFAYSYSPILIEFKDTIKSSPEEHKTMKKAILIGIATTTIYYMFCGCFGYAALGDMTPENLLTNDGFHNPYWLIDIANVAIIIYLTWSYQVNCRPLFGFVEKEAARNFPGSKFINNNINISIPIYGLEPYELNLFRLVWRTIFVCMTTFVVMVIPFLLDDIVRVIGAISFWSLTVYIPVQMYIVQKKIWKWNQCWVLLQVVCAACFIILMCAATGSVAKMVYDLKTFKPFKISN